MKLWLDDLREKPTDFGIQVFTAQAAINFLAQGNVQLISLDHDLGPEEAGTGYEVACWIEKQAALGSLPKLIWKIHSANPVGHQKMQIALENADRYWKKQRNENDLLN